VCNAATLLLKPAVRSSWCVRRLTMRPWPHLCACSQLCWTHAHGTVAFRVRAWVSTWVQGVTSVRVSR
jgi:hypothetical protein